MKPVEIYIGTTLRGSARGIGKGMYIMRARLAGDRAYEKMSAVEIDGGTESRLVLYCLRDSLARFRYACEVSVYTECTYVAAAVNSRWAEGWKGNGWTTGRGSRVKDAGLWRDILWQLEDTGHTLRAVAGKHEFSGWMRANLPRLYAPRDIFGEVGDGALNPVDDRIGGRPMASWHGED